VAAANRRNVSADATGAEAVSAAGKVYQQSVTEMLAAEFERRKTLEARGTTLTTSSGSLVALIFGLTVLVTGKDPVLISLCAVYVLLASLAFFVFSAIIGIVVQTYLQKYDVADCDFLETLATSNEEWSRTADYAVRTNVSQKVRTLCSLRRANGTKARWVIAGLIVQLGAIALLAVSLGIELYTRLT
jgi:hypothetical protein